MLFESLKNSNYISKITISGCKFENDGFISLAEMIKVNKSLKTLSLEDLPFLGGCV